MHTKKLAPFKSLFAACRRVFRKRNIIIISEHKVEHVPVSGITQLLALVGALGLFSGVSYLTGSYVSARSSLQEKERKIVSTTLEKVRIGEEMSLLKHDMARLSQNGKELSEYGQYLATDKNSAKSPGYPDLSSQLFGQDSSGLLNRVSYLEGRLKEIQEENEHLVLAIRTRTDKKISEFEDIISMTGLDSQKIQRMAVAVSRPTAQEIKSAHPGNQSEGGPFIPYDSLALNDSDRDLLSDVDHMVVLHDIIDRLPLRKPISGAATTGPFGKRIDPINGRWAIHPGVDLAGPAGSKIYATSAGRVISASHHAAYGNMVDIDHGFGIVTRYAHMSKIVVKAGEHVSKGQQVGVQGSTGRSTGAHLHYEVRINDRPVNPVKFLNAGEYVSENE